MTRFTQKRSVIILGVLVISTFMILSGCVEEGKEKSIKVVEIAPKDMQASLDAKDVSGYIAWEPYASDSVVGGKGKVLFRSGEIWAGHPCCVVAAKKSYAESKPDAVQHFLKAHMEATSWMINTLADNTSANYTLLVQIAVNFTQRSEAVLKEALSHMTYIYQLNNELYSSLKTYTDKLIEFEIVTQAKITEQGYQNTDDFVNKYVNDSYLEDAALVTPTSTNIGTVRVGYIQGDLHQLAYPVAKNATVGGGQSLFAKYGITVNDASGAPYANGGFVMDHFQAGDVDIGYLGCAPAVTKHLNAGIGTVILAQANNEGSAIIVAKDIDSLNELRGKKVGIPGFSTVQYFLLRMIAEEEGVKIAT